MRDSTVAACQAPDLSDGQLRFGGSLDGDVVTIAGGSAGQTFTFVVKR
jgi:hypothetical protein